MRFFVVAAIAAVVLSASYDTSRAQTADQAVLKQRAQLRAAREQYRERLNENVIYLMGGQLGAGYAVMAHDISVVVNQGDNLRVLPVGGGAGVQNVRDVAFLRGIDLGITNLLTLNHLKATGELGVNLDQQITYIAPLFLETLHILARPEYNRIEDLRGKKIAFNYKGSATAQFAPLVFKALGIEIQDLYIGQADAMEKMRTGEVDATACTCPVPVPAFASAKPEWGFKLLPVPFSRPLEDNYYPSRLTHEEYPNLIPKEGADTETIATASVLIAFNWARDTARYARIARFTEAMFTRFEDFQKPPRHPLWKTVNLAGKLPGWQRFPAAQEWIDRFEKDDTSRLQSSFAQFMAGRRASMERNAAADQERLFREFIEWRARAAAGR